MGQRVPHQGPPTPAHGLPDGQHSGPLPMLHFRPPACGLGRVKGQKAGCGGCPPSPWMTSALLNAVVQLHVCLITVAAPSQVCAAGWVDTRAGLSGQRAPEDGPAPAAGPSVKQPHSCAGSGTLAPLPSHEGWATPLCPILWTGSTTVLGAAGSPPAPAPGPLTWSPPAWDPASCPHPGGTEPHSAL